jgi:threonine synthase
MYISTRGNAGTAPSYEAVYLGMAPGGGLFVPQTLPGYSAEELAALKDLSYPALAASMLNTLMDDYPLPVLRDYAAKAYGEPAVWGDADPAPVKMIRDGLGFLELFHGPTAAFKDMALQIMPRLLTYASQRMDSGKEILILVATSGDTGKAALEGFKNVPGIRIIVFYPHGGVSSVQEAQMETTDGDNTYVCAVEGNFDDCQNGVKAIFGDEEMIRLLEGKGVQMSSANSINWGRLAPQIVYYFHAYFELCGQKRLEWGRPVNFVVPTGNFGNILAGWYAKQMGLPIGKLICASNMNKVLTDFFRTGVYDRHRPFYNTSSPSMDILISSNLERFLFELSGRDGEMIQKWMGELSGGGRFRVGESVKKAMDEVLWAGFSADEDGAGMIRKIYGAYRYVMDPHTAVGMAVYEQYRDQTGDGTLTLIDATASPFKFGGSVLAALNDSAASGNLSGTSRTSGTSGNPSGNLSGSPNEFEALRALSDLTGAPAHPALLGLEKRPRLHRRFCRRDEMKSVVLSILY